MPAKATALTADFFYIDNKGFEGHIQMSASDADILFAHIVGIQEKAETYGFKPREKKPSTFVSVTKPRVSKNPNTPTDPMAQAAVDAGMGMNCPVCQTAMSFRQADGALAKTGRFAGQPLPDRYNCPNCQKTVWLGRKNQEIPF